MKAATIILLLALGALALAHRDGSDSSHKSKDHGYKNKDHGYKKKDDRYNHHSSSSSSPEHRYRHREHRRNYKRDTAAVTPLPAAATTTLPAATTALPATTTLPLATTVAPKGRQADAIATTTSVPATTTLAAATTTLAAATTTLAAKGRQADFFSASTSTTEMPTSVPSVIGTPIQTSQDCDFSCKFFTLVNAEDGTPVSFNYRTSPTCLQVDAFCEPGFTLVTYGSFAPVPLDSADNGHGIINCFNSTWFDMNGDSGSNVMCINDANVNHLFTSTTPVSSSDVITEAVPIEQTMQTTTILPFAPETMPIEQTMQTTTLLPFAPTGSSNAVAPMTTN